MDYSSMTLSELREVARSKEVKGLSNLKKAELVQLLQESDATSKPAEKAKPAERKNASESKPAGKIVQRFDSKPEIMRYESRPARTEVHTETKSSRTEVQEPQNYDAENRQERSSEEKKGLNIRNEAFTKEEFLKLENPEILGLDSGSEVNGILEIMEGYGFIRSANYLPGENDVYVSPAQIRRFNLKTGDILKGNTRVKTQAEKFCALLFVTSVNGFHPLEAQKRRPFEELTPIFPDEKIRLEQDGAGIPMRIVDMIAPIGKGQRGMIVSPPKAGKTTLLKQMAKTISRNYRDMHMLVLLIDERPEEVTDIRESIEGPNVEVIYSTFDELPEHHKRVAEMVLDRAKRLVEHKKDVIILLDSITRLARAYNLIVPPSGRTLTGGLDPAALHMPKKFFGAARNIREGGSLTILATALVETGSKMDDVVFEEFKGTGNMELVLDRKLSEKRIFPALDISKSSTRREDLLLTKEEQDAMYLIRREISGAKGDEAIEEVLKLFVRTKNNEEFLQLVQKSLGRR
ncbi:MAG: transcription termination factor Rho [Lachnospiraceae bacterium]|nr:transcription termination factor Rho [Lachnospiraceae bacterium]